MRNRGWLALALGLLGGCGKTAPAPPTDPLETALQRLSHPDPAVRHPAMQEVAKAGPRAARGIPDLLIALKDDDDLGRYWAATGLRHMGTAAQGATDALIEAMLNDRDPAVRAAATKALIPLGAPVAVVLAPLERALSDVDLSVRRYALDALRMLEPGMKRVAADVLYGEAQDVVPIGACFKTYDGAPSTSNLSAWPHFLGPDYDGVSRERCCLLDRFPESGPKVLWEVETGVGYGGAVVRDGRVFFQDYAEGAERLRCVSLDDGREIWRRWHEHKVINQHGYTHSTPTVSEEAVAVVGPTHHLLVVEPKTGRMLWALDMDRAFGTAPEFRVQSPLIDGQTMVVAVGGAKKFLAGFEIRSGRMLWSTPKPDGIKLSLSSIVPMTWRGRRTYVYRATGGVLGVSTSGQLLWFEPCGRPLWGAIAAPLVLDGGRLLLTYGYGGGSRVIEPGEGLIWERDVRAGLGSEAHLTPALDDFVFGVAPSDAGAMKEQFVCMDPKDGRVAWASGPGRRFGPYAPALLADGKFFIRDKEGQLVIVRARTDRYEELSVGKLGGADWAALPALAGGRLIVRESKRLVCVDLRD